MKVSTMVERAFEDALKKSGLDGDAEARLRSAFLREIMEIEDRLEKGVSRGWLASNWRPLTMLVFVGLIISRWFGLTDPRLSEAEYLKIWEIIEIGIGGYMIGRSAEKVANGVAEGLRR